MLRLISMMMIVGYHYVWFSNRLWITEQPFSLKKLVYESIYGGGGWIGNFIFFTISVWFLIDRESTIRSGLRRIWIMERELLFWSIILFAVMTTLKRTAMPALDFPVATMAVKSALPLLTSLWWYPTSYALFLLFLPFLTLCLKKLTKRQHGGLAILMIILWGVLGLLPKITLNMTRESVFVFIYWYVLLSYYRWHMTALSKRGCWTLLGVGAAMELIYALGTNLLFQATGKFAGMQEFGVSLWRLPTMMIGFAIFLLCLRVEFHSRIINTLAASAFGIYLIHCYSPAVFAMMYRYLPLQKAFNSPHPYLSGLAAVLGICTVCLAADLIRQGLFALTVDRNRGAWFERLYPWIICRIRDAWTSIHPLRQPNAPMLADAPAHTKVQK